MIKKMLIANRGEIALRITRACKELGIKTVAVYSLEDFSLMHVHLADEAICIGGINSYNNIQLLIHAAKMSNVDSIHPGYGFLSENPYFARIARKNGFLFIGSSYKTIRIMGDKIHASSLVSVFDSGYKIKSYPVYLDKNLTTSLARKIGYPVLIKSPGSGGGRNIHIVYTEKELIKSIKLLEAGMFRDPFAQVAFMEKFVKNTKHIEFQIISDGMGGAVHLGERDCSVQHSYKKIIEESPAICITKEQREEVGDFCVAVCKKIGYKGVGTFEFLYSNKRFYFIEMNTRIQVEHPVTEAITGIDIIKEQIRIASGNCLRLRQKDVVFTGHAIECRINAEDFTRQSLAGTEIKKYHQPGGIGIRIDSHLYNGYRIQPAYDPLLVKIISHGENRQVAIARMQHALDEIIIEGVPTNIFLHKLILKERVFIQGEWDTEILDTYSAGHASDKDA